MFSAGLSVVWVGDFFGFDQILDRVFEFETVVCEVTSGLVKFTVGIWIIVRWESGWFRFEEALSLESFKYLG